MKNKNKIWLISFGCIGFGIVLLIAGLILGGRPGFYVNRQGIHAVNDVTSESPYVQEKKSVGEFTSMDISADYADIQIIPSDGYYIEYRLDGSNIKPLVEIKNKKLTFKEGRSSGLLGFNLFNFGSITKVSEHYQVMVYVPKNIYFQNISLNSDDGNIHIGSIRAASLQITDDYGEVNMESFQGERLTVDMDDGTFTAKSLEADRMDITNNYGNCEIGTAKGGTLSAELDDGTFVLSQTELTDLNVENDYGNVQIGLAKEMEAYDLNLETDYGDIQVPGYTDVSFGEDEKQFQTNNHADNRIKVTCDDGNIMIKDKK